MLKDGINGCCMALADSVPRVSGGTVAFIMGLTYEKRMYYHLKRCRYILFKLCKTEN